jgi:hypothetical protein
MFKQQVVFKQQKQKQQQQKKKKGKKIQKEISCCIFIPNIHHHIEIIIKYINKL